MKKHEEENRFKKKREKGSNSIRQKKAVERKVVKIKKREETSC
jgi:hypothetical protein